MERHGNRFEKPLLTFAHDPEEAEPDEVRRHHSKLLGFLACNKVFDSRGHSR